MVDKVSCPACLGSHCFRQLKLSHLPPGAQSFSSQPKHLNLLSSTLLECQLCGHFFLHTKPVDYYKSVIRATGISPSMQAFRANQLTDIKERYFFSQPTVRCLEIGAASGDYSALIASIFDNCVATEKSPAHSRVINSNITWVDTHPDEADFLTMLGGPQQFDLVTCFSYLEHLPSPFDVLSKIHQLVKPNGKILLEVPNSSFIITNSLVNEIIPDHLHYFTANSIHRIAHRASLSLNSLSSIWDDYILSVVLEPSTPRTILDLATSQDAFRTNVDHFLRSYSSKAKIVVWGAGHQSLYAISSTSLRRTVSFIVDSSPAKQGLFAPGLDLHVKPPIALTDFQPDLLIIACAGYNQEVVRQSKSLNLDCDIATLNAHSLQYVY